MDCGLCGCSGFVSGSADKEVKFWEWAIIEQEGVQARQLTINNTRTLKMTDDVLCVRISPNGRLHKTHYSTAWYWLYNYICVGCCCCLLFKV